MGVGRILGVLRIDRSIGSWWLASCDNIGKILWLKAMIPYLGWQDDRVGATTASTQATTAIDLKFGRGCYSEGGEYVCGTLFATGEMLTNQDATRL